MNRRKFITLGSITTVGLVATKLAWAKGEVVEEPFIYSPYNQKGVVFVGVQRALWDSYVKGYIKDFEDNMDSLCEELAETAIARNIRLDTTYAKAYIKPLGSAGSIDPINQMTLIGIRGVGLENMYEPRSKRELTRRLIKSANDDLNELVARHWIVKGTMGTMYGCKVYTSGYFRKNTAT